MKRKYELTAVLDTLGKEDSVDDIVQRIGREIESGGCRLDQIDHIGKKDFAYTPTKLTSGYYVSFLFEGDPNGLEQLRATLALDKEVHLQHYQKV